MSVGVFDSQFRVAVRSLAASTMASLFSLTRHDCVTCGTICTINDKYLLSVYTMDGTKNKKFLFLVFFEFLVSWQKMGDKKQEINFLNFLLNFGQILTLFDDISKYNDDNTYFCGFKVLVAMSFCIFWSFGGRKLSRLDLLCSDFTNLQCYIG